MLSLFVFLLKMQCILNMLVDSKTIDSKPDFCSISAFSRFAVELLYFSKLLIYYHCCNNTMALFRFEKWPSISQMLP